MKKTEWDNGGRELWMTDTSATRFLNLVRALA